MTDQVRRSGRRHHGRRALLIAEAAPLVECFAARLREEGASVALVTRDAAEGIHADLGSAGAVRAAVREGVAALGGSVDALVHVPASPEALAVADISEARWTRALAEGVGSFLHAAQTVLPVMTRQRRGRIVTVSSAIVRQPVPNRALHIAVAMGTVGLVRALASEVGDLGVTVNAIAPSVSGMDEDGDPLVAEITAAQAVRRPQRPEDLSGTVSFLVSDDAAFITGQTFNVDGGLIPF